MANDTDEFRIEAVRQITEKGYSIAEVAVALGQLLTVSTIRLRNMILNLVKLA